MFDVTIQALGFSINAPENPDDVPPGQEAQIELLVAAGIMLPLQMGPGQPPLMVPVAQIHVPLNPSAAVQLGEKLAEQGKRFPDKPNLVTANSLDGLEHAQDFEQRLRGNG